MGYRKQYYYDTPKIRPNSAFNYWLDIKSNVLTRNRWEDTKILDGETTHNTSQVLKSNTSSNLREENLNRLRGARSPQLSSKTGSLFSGEQT